MKRTLSVTFNDEEWEMMERANETTKHWLSDCFTRRWRQWLIRQAVYSVAREIANGQQIVMPMAVTLRTETPEEVDERCGRVPPGHPGFRGFAE